MGWFFLLKDPVPYAWAVALSIVLIFLGMPELIIGQMCFPLIFSFLQFNTVGITAGISTA